MSTQERDMKIRIRMNTQTTSRPDKVYEYYWGRILLAVLVMAVLIFTVVQTANSLLSERDKSTGTSIQAAALSPDSMSTSGGVAETQSSTAKRSGPAIKEPVVKEYGVTKPVDFEPVVSEPKASKTKASKPKASKPVVLSAVDAKDNAAHLISVPTLSNASTATSTAKSKSNRTVAHGKHVRKVSRLPVLSDYQTKIAINAIKRFEVSRGIRNKEPVGSFDDIRLDNNGMLTVYAFSEVLGMKDDNLQYVWYRNDKPVAKVKVGVWSNRWRSYSRKYINAAMRGDWRIELVNSHGERLAHSTFTY